MKKIHICIIDESLNLTELNEFHPYAPRDINILQTGEKPSPWFSHGTLCTGLLIESINALDILKYVSITHISISNSEGNRDYKKIISALKLCSKMDFDIVSMSIGSSVCNRGKDMVPLIGMMEHTIMICAAANDFSIVYPAALPSVIGVKRARVDDAPRIGVATEPADGIELIINLPLSDYLQKRSNALCEDFSESNSVLVPRICGILAHEMMKKQIRMTKGEAISFFSRIGQSSVESKFALPQRVPPIESESLPPIVFFPKRADHRAQMSTINLLQEKFEYNGYPCSIISDTLPSSDFQ